MVRGAQRDGGFLRSRRVRDGTTAKRSRPDYHQVMPKKRPPALTARLRRHFRATPATLPVVAQEFATYERANFHLALQSLLKEWDPKHQLFGVVTPPHYDDITLARLSHAETGRYFLPGAPEYVDVATAGQHGPSIAHPTGREGGSLSCLKRGLILLRDKGRPAALLVSEDRMGSHFGKFQASVSATTPDHAQSLLRRLAAETRTARAFRGNVLSVDVDCNRQLAVTFHRLPAIQRDDIILPADVLARVERLTLGMSKHADALKRAGRHLKRGLLLHGPPGTGKTLTAMYLASQMTGRTVILLTGKGMGHIETACGMARALEPATVILEDVDLIGTERDHQTVNANALLYELLNQMDGLAPDCDALFLLTTNRPSVLEPALAARPGRIDQARSRCPTTTDAAGSSTSTRAG